ncbi:MAG: DUF4838 domain-containing protein [Clostridia bacterium]|nr:DUF4838 domain-containing protein [Clostridia bacterium]
MKKTAALIVLLSLIVSSFIFAVPGKSVTHGYTAGDANDDGVINISDVLLVKRYIAAVARDRDVDIPAADANGDAFVDMRDVLTLIRVITGVEDAQENNTDGLYRVGEIKISGKNISRYTIVYPGDIDLATVYSPAMDYAIRELRSYIEDACGIKLNIASEGDTIDSYRIRYTYDFNNEYDIGKEGFVFRARDDGDFDIICGTQRGALYATYTFLEELIGYRFLTGDVEYLYKADTVSIPAGYYDRQVPGFEYRGVQQSGISDDWVKLKINALDGGARANNWDGGGLGTLYIHAHSFAYQMAGYDRAYDPYMNDFTNEFHTSQPCMTSDDTYAKILDFNYRLIEERESGGQRYGYHYTQVSCASNDNTNYCVCEKCKTVYELEGSVAGCMMRLANRVAEKMCADFPELDIYTIAYAGGNIPPKYTRPHEKVCVCFCTTGCNNHLLRDTSECDEAGGNPRMTAPIYYGGPVEPYNNTKDMAYMDAWLELTDNIYFWYYGANYNYFVSPAPNLFSFYDDIKYLAERGMIGIYAEGSSDPVRYSFEYLRSYLCSKIIWDPYMTEEEYERHMDEFLMIYYGDGWREIKEYIYMSNRASDINGCWTNNHDAPWDVYSEEYFKDNYSEMASLLDTALAKAESPKQKARVEMTSVHAHFLGLSATYDSSYVNGTPEERAAYVSRYEWLWNYYKDNAASSSNPEGIKATVFGSGIANFDNFPADDGDPVSPMSWIFKDGFDGHSGGWRFPFG